MAARRRQVRGRGAPALRKSKRTNYSDKSVCVFFPHQPGIRTDGGGLGSASRLLPDPDGGGIDREARHDGPPRPNRAMPGDWAV